MAYLDQVKQELAMTLGCEVSDFAYPPNASLGHLSLPLFTEAKKIGINPGQLASETAQRLNNPEGFDLPLFSNTKSVKHKTTRIHPAVIQVKAVGPYLNFFFDSVVFTEQTVKGINEQADSFGSIVATKQPAIMVEYANGNTHKELHVGHLRNIAYGSAVVNLLRAAGNATVPVSYVNDFGIHTAKTIWNWQRQKKYERATEPRGYLLGRCYSEAASLVETSEEAKQEVSQIMQAIESCKGEIYEFWKETRQWSIDYFDSVYQTLNVSFADTFYESEFIDEGLRIKDQLLEKGILKHSEGAVIADLSDEDLGVLPIIRSDGTALYAVADLALASAKFEKYQLQESIYVVDVRQSLYFKQLFAILRRMGYRERLTHLGYDFLTLKSGMMSSRTGNVVTFQEALTTAEEKASQEIRMRHSDWSDTKVAQVARALSIAALKFEMIKVAADKIITFDIEAALRFDGYTAAYLQYSGARAASLLAKGQDLPEADYTYSEEPELILAVKLESYPETIIKAAEERDPSILTRYLFELAQEFNDYYQKQPILKAEPNVAATRLSLVKAFAQVLRNGFSLLGFTYLEEM